MPRASVILGLVGVCAGGGAAVLAALSGSTDLVIASVALAAVAGCGSIASLGLAAARLSARLSDDAAQLRESLDRARSFNPGVEITSVDSAVDLAADAVRAGRESERQLRAIVDGIDDVLLATDAQGVIVIANSAASTEFDRVGQLAGRAIEDVLAQAQILEMHRAALQGSRRRAQVRLPRAGQNRVWQVSALPVPLLQGAGAVLTLRDVTDLAAAVQLKTDFVANASHELRTPLSSIKAAVETMNEGAKDEPPMRDRLLTMIGGNVVRLEELIADLMDLSRLETPDAPIELRVVRLGEIEEAMRALFDGVCKERSLLLAFTWQAGLYALYTDPKLVSLILKNLIENATKFASEGTTIRVTGEDVGEGRVRLRVIDRGVGIPLAHQARIFERFYQVDSSRAGTAARRGTGLGLAIVKHAVKSLGGSIGVESVWQQGTTMTVELPRAITSALQPGTTA